MKKLLILMLVLGMTSMASAVVAPLPDLSTYIDSVTIGIVDWTLDIVNNKIIGTGTSLGYYDQSLYMYPTSADAGASVVPVSSKGAYDAAGDNGAFTGTAVLIAHAEDLIVGEGSVEQSLGDWFYMNLTPGSALDGQFCLLWSDGTDWHVGLTAQVQGGALIPEPMTIALLGLGGLFLLRRRK